MKPNYTVREAIEQIEFCNFKDEVGNSIDKNLGYQTVKNFLELLFPNK